MITRVKGSVFSFKDNANYVALTDVGGIGDGVFDNTTAMNLALTYGIPVLIPPGTFLIRGITVPASASIFGIGSSSILKLKTASNSVALTCTGGIDFSSFTLDCNKAGQLGSNLHGILLTNGITANMDELSVTNPLGDGINITGVNTLGIRISRSRITGFVKNGITVEQGTDIAITNTKCSNSDVIASPGDGISLAAVSAGVLVSDITISGCRSRNNVGRGLSILGNGSKNVTDVNVNGGSFSSNNSHGIHAFTAQAVTVNGCTVKGNGGDGGRLEGDVQYSRVSECVFNTNTGTCLREVTTGATPNLNGLIYNVALGNGSNVVVKVGAGSFIV